MTWARSVCDAAGVVWTAIAVLASLNLATWAIYRVDKARAGRGARRISERTLLSLAAAGGSLGALIAVYAHRRRHKASKPSFVILLWSIVIAQTVLAAALLARVSKA